MIDSGLSVRGLDPLPADRLLTTLAAALGATPAVPPLWYMPYSGSAHRRLHTLRTEAALFANYTGKEHDDEVECPQHDVESHQDLVNEREHGLVGHGLGCHYGHEPVAEREPRGATDAPLLARGSVALLHHLRG